MSSPFKLFRKHQREMLVALFVMAMFAFVLGDPLLKMFGNRGSRQAYSAQAATVVTIDSEELKRPEINDLIQRRNMANRFVQAVFMKTRRPDESELFKADPRIAYSQLQQELRSRLFQFNPYNTIEQDVVFGYILRKEADRLGATVTDSQIERYIENTSRGRLSTRDFQMIVSELRQDKVYDPRTLYSVLRDELLARLALGQLLPHAPDSPEKYWEYYRRLHESQQIEAVELPVEAFTDQVPAPSQEKLEAFFEENKKFYDRVEEGEPKPGFKQPDKVRAQYLQWKYADVEARIAREKPISDKDVADFYEKNKDFLYVETNPSLETTGPATPDPTRPLDPLLTKPEAAPQTPAPPANSKPADAKNASPAASQPVNAKPEAPLAVPQPKPQPEVKPETKPASPSPAAPVAAPPVKPAVTKPANPAATQPESKKQSRRSHRARVVLVSSLADPKKEETKKEVPQPEPAKVTAPAVKNEPAKNEPAQAAPPEKKSVTPALETPPAGQPAPKLPAGPALENPPPAAPAGKPPVAAPAQPAATPTVPPAGPKEKAPAPPPAKKYRPLDDNLKQEIRSQLLRERTVDEMKSLGKQADAGLRASYSTLSKKFPLMKMTPADQVKVVQASRGELQQLAKKLQATFGETPLVNRVELSKITGFGTAREPGEFMQQTPGTVDQLFNSSVTLLGFQAQDQTTQDWYAYWKVEHVANHVPKFTDPGIEAQVLRAWKLREAQPLAKKRAEELAQMLKQSKKTTAEALGSQTVTGSAKGRQVAVLTPPMFTWAQISSAVSGMLQQNQSSLRPTEIPRIGTPGESFMRVVYNDLHPGEWGVAPRDDRTAFYVVKLVDRKSPPKEELLKAPLFADKMRLSLLGPTPYDEMAQMESYSLYNRFRKHLNDKHRVKWAEPVANDSAATTSGPMDDE